MFEDLVDLESINKQLHDDNVVLAKEVKEYKTALAVMLAENFDAKILVKEAQIFLMECKSALSDEEWAAVESETQRKHKN